MDVHRFELWFGRSREAKQLIDQESIRSISCPIKFEKVSRKSESWYRSGQQLREGLDRYERVFDFVGHTGGKRAETGETVAAPDLHFEPLQRRNISQHH